jgi:hypothetical protein
VQITRNTTQYLAECFAFSDKAGVRHCAVVVKGTFDVNADGDCRSSDQPVPWVFADEHHGDPGTTSLRWESDFAPCKPRVDILISAEATAPAGHEATRLQVGLQGPGIDKQAVVTGDRVWNAGIFGLKPSDPLPFRRMPLVWDRAFGGSDLSHAQVGKHGTHIGNPVGVDFHLNGDSESIRGKALPNIECADGLLASWSDKPTSIGFGSVGRGWSPRLQFAGTYDQRWIDETMPFLPQDFDNRYFQSAPIDQQLDELPDGSVFRCRNMTDSGDFVVRIPLFQVPVRYLFDDRSEVQMLGADTVILQPSQRRLILVGRVAMKMPRKMTALREIHVGTPRRAVHPDKPHYASLGQAVSALGRRR